MNDFVTWLDTRSWFYVHSKNAMGSTWSRIQVVLAECAVHLTFEKAIQGIFLWLADVLVKAFNENSTARVVSNLKVLVLVHHIRASLSARK